MYVCMYMYISRRDKSLGYFIYLLQYCFVRQAKPATLMAHLPEECGRLRMPYETVL